MTSRPIVTTIISGLSLLVLTLLAAAVGCSHSGTAVSPTDGPAAGLRSFESRISAEADKIPWGVWDISMNDAGEFEVVPARSVEYTINVVNYLQPPAGSLANLNVVIIDESEVMLTGRIVIDVTLTHPFPDYPEYSGFDILGVLIHHGSVVSRHDASLKYAQKSVDAVLNNADGYTRWMNPNEFTAKGIGGFTEGTVGKKKVSWTATANPYKYFCDGLTATEDIATHYTSALAVSNRGVFKAGSNNTRRYDLTFPMVGGFPIAQFQYAAVASWTEPANTPPASIPGDWGPDANLAEPFYVTVNNNGSTAYWNSSSDRGGDLILNLEIFDQGAAGDPNGVEGQIDQIIVESASGFIQGTNNTIIFGSSAWTVSAGTTSLSKVFILDCGPVVPQGSEPENNEIFIAVRSKYGSYDTGIGTPHPSSPLRYFQRYNVIMSGWVPQTPGDVTGFAASDGDISLANRAVKLTWTEVANATRYSIQRYDYNSGTETWSWSIIHMPMAGTSLWTDTSARYCGTAAPINYRIRAENSAGNSPGWATDTGYPKPRRVRAALWCAADNSSGGNAVVPWSRGTADFTDANTFWNKYGFEFVLQNSGNFFWMTNAAYRDLSGGEDELMHGQFGKVSQPNAINVYYVNSSAGGDTMRAYCVAYCPGSAHTTQNILIVMGKDSRDPGCSGTDEAAIVLAHELGHGLARYWDVYLMDTNANVKMDDGTSCSINTWCNGTPYSYYIPKMYCDISATYPENPNSQTKIPKNLMWYSFCGAPISDYNLTVGQYIYVSSWVTGNEAAYPAP